MSDLNQEKNVEQVEEATPTATPSSTNEEHKAKQSKTIHLTKGRWIAICIFAIVSLLAFLIVNHRSINTWFGGLKMVFAPVIIGVTLAYLLNPAYKFFAYVIFKKLKHPHLRKALSLICTYIWLFLVLWLVVILIVPQFLSSFTELISNLNFYATNTIKMVNSVLNFFYKSISNMGGEPIEFISEAAIAEAIQRWFGNTQDFLNTIVDSISKYQTEIISSGTQLISSIYRIATNFLFGFFISLYLLASKDKRLAQIKKINTALFEEKTCTRIHKLWVLTNRSFGGFINGKMLDSLIIGVMTLILLLIFHFPYPLLIATIIGVTNIIPVIGPFIGAIPTALLILIVRPSLFIPFIILVVVIQQIDGNIIGPSILGDSVGVSSLCIFIVICVMGALFGIIGMLIGVPLAAVIIEIIKQYVEHLLRKKKKDASTVYYYPSDTFIDPVKDVDDRTDKLRLRFQAMSNRKRLQITAMTNDGQNVSFWHNIVQFILDLGAGNKPIFGKPWDTTPHLLFDIPYESINNLFDDGEELAPDMAEDILANEARHKQISPEDNQLTDEERDNVLASLKDIDARVKSQKNKDKRKKKN